MESLVVCFVITVALIGTAASINIATQQRQRASQRNALSAAIDADLSDIQDLATQLTCCSGQCTLGIPTGVTPGPPPSTCFTDNRRDDRYFFPQTLSQAQTVDVICRNESIISDAVLAEFNAIPVNADLTAAGGTRQPIVRFQTVDDQPGNQNILQITYTDNNAADPNAPLRVARVVPPMARFCP